MLNSTLKIAATAKGLNRVDREPGLLSGFLVPPTVYEVFFKKGFSVKQPSTNVNQPLTAWMIVSVYCGGQQTLRCKL